MEGKIKSTLLVIVLAFYGLYQCQYAQTRHMVTFTVNDKTVKVSEGTSTYMVYTTAGVFKNEDDLLRQKYNSSDVFNDLKVGQTYTCTVIGWRYPLFPIYPNILRVGPEIPAMQGNRFIVVPGAGIQMKTADSIAL